MQFFVFSKNAKFSKYLAHKDIIYNLEIPLDNKRIIHIAVSSPIRAISCTFNNIPKKQNKNRKKIA